MIETAVENPFKPGHLAARAQRLARTQTADMGGSRGHPLRPLIREADRDLTAAYRALAEAGRAGEPLTPAAEWLLDNIHVVRDAFREVEEALPAAYYRVLPKLTAGPYEGLPRVYELAEALAEIADNAVGQDQVEAFVQGYQEVDLLTLAELWALPILLRLVLARHVAALARLMREALGDRHVAAGRVATLLAADQEPVRVMQDLAALARERAPLSGPFVLSFASTLQAGGGHAVAMEWLEHRLRARRLTLGDVEQVEMQRETQWQGSLSNAVLSLRAAAKADWVAFVERHAAVERTLREDPAGVYARMDLATRDAYRHEVERFARRSDETEFGVAERAVALAREAAEAEERVPASDHVGYWLVGPGAPTLGRSVRYHARLGRRLSRLARRHPTAVYLGGVASVTAVGLAVALFVADAAGADAAWIALAVAAAFLPLLDFAVAFVNWNVVRFFPPYRLPRLDYSDGLPPEARTFVVVPTLITSPAHAREMAERLEVHALANPDPALRYALLTDWADAPEREMPGDAATVDAARRAIRRLNERAHAFQGMGDRFVLLHRERRWNPAQGVWMGWERKRGKLEEFNDLLRDPNAETSYVTIEGDLRAVTEGDAVRYVLTLDADTRTAPHAARDLVATAMHPLNRPQVSARRGRVTEGYGVLQPRVSVSPESGRQTPFARIYAGRPGVDPYTTAVSDAYMDLFREGIYTGKGLYDVDAFRRTLAGAVPENTVLSHDLLEGNHARAALATGVEVFDDFPSRYASFSARLHRWVRGDWQLLPWLLPRVKDARGRWRRNPLSVVGRWKLFDNLRRSLTPPALLVFLLLAWTVLPGSPFAWTLIALFVLAFPIYAPAVHGFVFQPPDTVTSSWLRLLWADVALQARQIGLSVAFLAHQSVVMLDAVGRTLWRVLVTRKNLLEWTTAQQAEDSAGEIPGSMWASVAWGLVVLASVTVAEPVAWVTALPFAAAWIAAPWIARRVSRPLVRSEETLADADRLRLRRVARRTWRFFDDALSEADRWLPPDNLQVQPAQGYARRTSPTNIGLALNAVQAACDLGYLTRTEEVRRVGLMLDSIETLERYRGHLYNWYSTETGAVMAPRYVSTVDSGNLAGALLALKQGLLETSDAPWPSPALRDGLTDTLGEMEAAQDAAEPSAAPPSAESAPAGAASGGEDTRLDLRPLQEALAEPVPRGIEAWRRHLAVLDGLARPLAAEAARQPEEVRAWAEALAEQAGHALAEVDALAPWLREGAAPLPDAVRADLDAAPSLGGLALRVELHRHEGVDAEALGTSHAALAALFAAARALAERADRIVGEMDFRPLYDPARDLFHIGYDAGMARQDPNTYDLLASESRLASLLAVAKGEAPPKHWFHLSRPTRVTGVRRALLSWSGTMFEYLMPVLYTRLYPQSLLADACYNAVSLQRAFGRAKNRPWGISESAYAHLDLHLTYQYRAFGVPALGLRRGLAEDYVVSPYSTLLALLVQPVRALANLDALDALGALGPSGYYEALDFTPARVTAPESGDGTPYQIVRSYMAHHQGMGLVAVTNALRDGVFQTRFHRDPLVRSVEILLQERVPTVVEKIDPHPLDEGEVEPVEIVPVEARVEHFGPESLHDPVPHAALLSNGRYSALVTTAGTGGSRLGDVALTRWHGDRSRDDDGLFVYVRDVESGRYWSAAHRPVTSAPPPDRFDAWVHAGKIETARVDDWIETFTEVVVSPEDDAEVRRVTVTNYADRPRTIELTSYAEVVLQPLAADLGHPAFSKLFVETEYLPKNNALLATRRPRAEGDARQWLVHSVADRGLARADRAAISPLEYETDRMRFIGRGRTLDRPAALDPGARLSRTAGAVLDPVVSLRRVVTLQPKQSAQVVFTLAVAGTREEAERLAERYDHPDAARRAIELASTYSLVELGHAGLTGEEALNLQELGGRLAYGDPRLAAPADVRQRNARPQSGLWAYGISGDLPVLLFRTSSLDELEAFRLLLKAHAFWRHRGLELDLVALNDHPPSYADDLQEALSQAVEASPQRGLRDQRGGVFLLRADGMAEDDLVLLQTAARAVLHGVVPDLLSSAAEQEAAALAEEAAEAFEGGIPGATDPDPHAVPATHPDGPARLADAEGARERQATPPGHDLDFYNGYGGFTEDGRAYVIRQRGGATADRTPLPWINVVANPAAGFTASESGEGYTWARNSQQNKLTPWSNDPVMDPAGEALYLRDDDAGVFWTPTPQPVPAPALYTTRHGWGATTWTTEWGGLATEMTAFVPRRDPVKVVRLRVTNASGRARRLSLYRYAEWVLGERREPNAPYVVVERDDESGAILAHNPYNATFGTRLAFVAVGGADVASVSARRRAFLGPDGHASDPLAVRAGGDLDGDLATDLDPCAALHVPIELAAGETREVTFLLGQAKTPADVRTLVARYRPPEAADLALSEVTAFWEQTLGAVHVQTPAPDLDVLVNGWLLYQTLSCRLWGRSAFYQSGGAYGFRDQLQDSLPLVYTRPDLTRAQILKNAAHQFEEGDVLHWWHPVTGAGIRTRFSDDLLWLPYAVAFALETTGDETLLDEEAPFITARLLEPGEDEVYLTPQQSGDHASVYEHAARAIDRSLTRGRHGLPLMGSGDWNDGMNRVGDGGEGESVWLGFFLAHVLERFIPICEGRNDRQRAERYESYLTDLKTALNADGWDGTWYRRAFYDDGTPLGSASNDECRIDAIAQGWSIISGVAPDDRVGRVLDAVDQHLVDERAGIIRLLTPPFDVTDHDPGYIKGYLPGVRENGGQYTHGVLWAVRAFAEAGRHDRAAELLRMILPVNHALTPAAADKYKAEPYVVAADVYSVEPHVGRGGWTWYTGSAGWMWRVSVESLLGLRRDHEALLLTPRVPDDWPGYTLRYRADARGTVYVVRVVRDGPGGAVSAEADGEALDVDSGTARIPLVSDGAEHAAIVRLGRGEAVPGA